MRALTVLAALALALLADPALAVGDTPEDFAREGAAVLQGPLALSADGQWRLHVDAHNVLHRVNLADPSRSQALALPVPVRLIAASRSGQKVALLIARTCVGRVDFGSTPGAVARIDWRPDTAPHATAQPWGPQLPATCRESAGQSAEGPDVLAISSDGRQVATAGEVVDVDTPRVVATLPRGREQPLLLRFVDGDLRLLVVSAFLGQTTGSEIDPSRLEIATWDLATQTLHALSTRALTDGANLPSLLPAYAARAGELLTSTPEPWRNDGKPRLPTALETWHLATCRATPDARPPITDWTSIAVDPSGRWIAGTRALVPEQADEAEFRAGFRNELVVQDVATGRRLARRAWKHELQGLIFNADGSALFALVAPSSVRFEVQPSNPADPPEPVGEVIEFRLPPQATRAPAATPVSWSREPCLADREQPEARNVTHHATAFTPRWTTPAHRFTAKLAPAPIPPQMPAGSLYPCRGSCSDIFVRTDSSLWVDDGTTIAQIHPEDGRRLRTLPTPRTDKVSSVVLATSGGFFNAQGDTLSWRPFDAPGTAMRQVVDRRPGWEIILLQRQGNTMLVAWVRKAPANAPADAANAPRPTTYAIYSNTARLIRETQGTEDADGDSWSTSDELQHTLWMRNVAPCHDETGALAEGHDLRIGPFGSVVAWACGPGPGAARIVMWSGMDATPRSVDEPALLRIVASDGTLGVVSDEQRPFHLRVFDAAQRRELGTIAVPTPVEIVDITADSDLGVVFVEMNDHGGPSGERRILAYTVR